jgi:hypothetical protein
LAGLPDPLLRSHETKGCSGEGEGGQVLLPYEQLTFCCESIEERYSGGPNQPIGLRIVASHRVESIEIPLGLGVNAFEGPLQPPD